MYDDPFFLRRTPLFTFYSFSLNSFVERRLNGCYTYYNFVPYVVSFLSGLLSPKRLFIGSSIEQQRQGGGERRTTPLALFEMVSRVLSVQRRAGLFVVCLQFRGLSLRCSSSELRLFRTFDWSRSDDVSPRN